MFLDAAFLPSQALTVNRKEIQTPYTESAKFDAVFHTMGSRQLYFGLMEVKPPSRSLKLAEKDRDKVIDGLLCLFGPIKDRLECDWDQVKEIVLVGIVTYGLLLWSSLTTLLWLLAGFTFRVLQCQHPASGIFVFKEDILDVSSQNTHILQKIVYQIKVRSLSPTAKRNCV